MRIEWNRFFEVKQNNTARKPTEKKSLAEAAVSAPKEDKLDFSSSAEVRDYSLGKAKSGVVSALRSDCEPARLEQLKAQVQKGSYAIPADRVASSILSGGISV